MPGKRARFVVLASVVALAATLAGARALLQAPQRLGPGTGETTAGVREAKVGDRLNVSLGGFGARGPDPVRVRAARVTGMPPGLRLVGLHALRGAPSIGAVSGDLQKLYPGQYDYRPVTEMVFHEGQPEAWSLLVIVEATAPGSWHTTGIEIDWSAGRHRGTAHFGYQVGMIVLP